MSGVRSQWERAGRALTQKRMSWCASARHRCLPVPVERNDEAAQPAGGQRHAHDGHLAP